MRKVFSFIMVALMSIITLNAAPFGIIVNGKHYFAGTENFAPMDPSFQEWMVLNVPLKSGDVLALYDEGSKSSLAVTLDQASTSGISKTSDTQYSCIADGCYDFYIKLKYQANQLYVGTSGSGCSDWGEDISVVTEPTAPANAESVDLGLPSGLKWATFNVGATTPEGYGDYFAWGETEPYYADTTTNPITWKSGKESGYAWQSYCGADEFAEWSTPPYNATTKILTPEYDAATANWGSDWRMPTKAEQDELRNNCDWEWTTDYNGTGIAGYIVKSKAAGNNNSIFLPVSGFRYGTSLNNVGSIGRYWSSSHYENYSDNAYYLNLLSNSVDWGYSNRVNGQSVRPVTTKSIVPTALPTLKNADKAPVRKYIKNGRFEMEVNGKKYNALGF